MARRCSHCNNDGHNSRTCPNRVVRLFGVRLTGCSSMQKSASTGNLVVFGRSAAAAGSAALDPHTTASGGSGYASEAFHGSSSSRERKKGVPWTEHEHKMFLLGLNKLGKGDWRGIARNYVMSRTPTQVASHAQKYFIRHSPTYRRKRRDSLFDIVTDDSTTEYHPSGSQEEEMIDSCWQPAPVSLEHADMKKVDSTTEGEATLSAPPSTMMYSYPPPIFPVFFPVQVPQVSNEQTDIKINSTAEAERTIIPVQPAAKQYSFPPPVYPGFYSAAFPCPMPYWPGYAAQTAVLQPCKIVRPTAVHSKNSINVVEHIGMSRPSLGVCYGEAGPPPLVPKLAGSSERQSAFHASASAAGSSLDSSSSPIHAI